MNLETYCPEIRLLINGGFGVYRDIEEQQRRALISNALIRRIKERGEWLEFELFAELLWHKTDRNTATFTKWLTTPETLIRVAGEWVKSMKGEK